MKGFISTKKLNLLLRKNTKKEILYMYINYKCCSCFIERSGKYMINKEIKKLEDEKRKYQKYCEFCGHTMSFYSFEKDKKLCNHCGKYNYKNDAIKFKYCLSELLK